MALGALASLTMLVAGTAAGFFAFRGAPDYAHLFAWDGIVLAVLFMWMIGLVADLQRAEALSLDRFLPLPVSLSGAFLVNYLSSLFSLNLMLFVPAMLGLSLGLVFGLGPVLLLVPEGYREQVMVPNLVGLGVPGL